jgi:hypothetical protein
VRNRILPEANPRESASRKILGLFGFETGYGDMAERSLFLARLR